MLCPFPLFVPLPSISLPSFAFFALFAVTFKHSEVRAMNKMTICDVDVKGKRGKAVVMGK
jgi:hypothetical protein